MALDIARAFPSIPSTTDLDNAAVLILREGRQEATTKLIVPRVSVLEETHTAASFTDGGAAVGTKTMTGYIPAGAVILGTKVLVPAGFAGNVSATMTIGDGSDAERYMTPTCNVFATAANGVQSGVPSGNKLQVTAVKPVLTVTSSTDFTLVLAGGGSVTVAIYYIVTV